MSITRYIPRINLPLPQSNIKEHMSNFSVKDILLLKLEYFKHMKIPKNRKITHKRNNIQKPFSVYHNNINTYMPHIYILITLSVF